MVGQRNSRLDRPFSIAGAPGLPVACKGFDIADRELQFGFHMPVALFRLVSRVTLNGPAQPSVPRKPVLVPWVEESLAAERRPYSAGRLGLQLQSRPPHARTS